MDNAAGPSWQAIYARPTGACRDCVTPLGFAMTGSGALLRADCMSFNCTPLPNGHGRAPACGVYFCRLGTDVRVTLRAKGKGQIHLSFYSNDDLARVLELILGAPFDG